MVEVNESLAGDPRAVPPEVYNWAADQVFKLSREQGAQPEGFWENAAGKSYSLAPHRSSMGLSKLHGSKCSWLIVVASSITLESSYFVNPDVACLSPLCYYLS
jgi:hypothetical protein